MQALKAYQVLDTAPEAEFDAIVELASAICKVPIALVSLLDEKRQWFKARVGLQPQETARDLAFCDHAIRQDGIMDVPDATKDKRFCDNPLVTSDPNIRFYAGAVLHTAGGQNLGTLCVIDTVARNLTAEQKRCLEILAGQVMVQLELRRANQVLAERYAALAKAQEEIQKSSRLFEVAINAMREGFVLQDSTGKIIQCNARAWQILGLTEDQLLGRSSIDPAWKCVREDGSIFKGEHHPAMMALREGLPQMNVPMGVHWSNGNLVWININAAPLFEAGSETPYGVLCTFSDVTEQHNNSRHIEQYLMSISENTVELEWQRQQLQEANAKLESLAASDGLTGLLNHRSFQDILSQTLAETAPTSLLVLDVDHFKSYNDRFGHPEGDEVLRTVASLLLEAVRPTDVVCRYGGEEFAIILRGAKLVQARIIADRVLKALRQYPWSYRGITASIGIATATSTQTQKADLIRTADQALYAAKGAGRDRAVSLPIEPVQKAS